MSAKFIPIAALISRLTWLRVVPSQAICMLPALMVSRLPRVMIQHVKIPRLFRVKICSYSSRLLARVPSLGLPRDQRYVEQNRALIRANLLKGEVECIDIAGRSWVSGALLTEGILHLPIGLIQED